MAGEGAETSGMGNAQVSGGPRGEIMWEQYSRMEVEDAHVVG